MGGKQEARRGTKEEEPAKVTEFLSLMTALPELPGTVTEQLDDVVVGKTTLPIRTLPVWYPQEEIVTLLNDLNSTDDKTEGRRKSLLHSMNNNTPNDNFSITHGRPVSAYFTHDPEHESLILEWGTIGADGSAKLHTHLNRVINFHQRIKNGMTLSSGHIARTPSGIHLALIDGLTPDSFVSKDTPMGQVINTLYGHNLVPIDSGGRVQLPAF